MIRGSGLLDLIALVLCFALEEFFSLPFPSELALPLVDAPRSLPVPLGTPTASFMRPWPCPSPPRAFLAAAAAPLQCASPLVLSTLTHSLNIITYLLRRRRTDRELPRRHARNRESFSMGSAVTSLRDLRVPKDTNYQIAQTTYRYHHEHGHASTVRRKSQMR